MRLRLASVGMLLIAAAFLGYWTLLVFCDVWRPAQIGLFLSFNAGRVQVVDIASASTAARAGIRTGDYLTAVDGHSVAGRLDWTTVVANLEIDQPIQLTVERQGAVTTATITPELASWQSWRSQHGPELLVTRVMQLVTLLLALLIAMKRSQDARAMVGAAFLATIGVFSLTLPYRFASVWRELPPVISVLLWIPFMSSVTIAAWGFSFFSVFPRVRFRSPLAWAAVWLPLLPGLLGHGVYGYHTIILRQPAPSSRWIQSLLVVGVVYVVAALAALGRNYRRLTDVNERRRVRVLVIGSLVGVLAGTPVVLSYWRPSANSLDRSFLASPFATLGTFLFLVLPLSFAYAILRHRLFDIRIMIRQGLRYALARRVLLALVPALLVLVGVDLLAHGDEQVGGVLRRRGWIYATIGGLAVVARSQRQEWLDALDRRFFRERYSARRLLRQVSDDLRQSVSLDPVVPTVVSRIEQAFHSTFVAVLAVSGDRRRFQTIAASPPHRAPDSFVTDNKVLTLAGLLGKPLEIDGSATDWLAKKLPVDDIRTIQAAEIELIVPLRSVDGTALGLIVLGPKLSEEPYTEDDGELLMAIAESLAARLAPVAAPVFGHTAGFEECPTCGDCYDSGTGRCRTEGAALATVAAPRRLSGRYHVERRLDRGGMATVYVALDTTLERRVAIKLIRPDLIGSPGAAERFQREARAAAAFSHPNVVTVHDFGVAGTHAFLVMELLDGPTLRHALRVAQPVPPERALAILRNVAAAVDAAHQRHIVHRDLKPENICLVLHGAVESAKVLDFGIARFLTQQGSEPLGSYTTGGALLGTPLYMAPEQLRGEHPDPSWDLWALAVIAFEMLSGFHPFAPVAHGLDASLLESPGDRRVMYLTTSCQQFFAGALALDRAARPESATAFLAQLEGSLRG
jgi:eukaryotic-like serine/threonine-protein kinase